MVIALLALPMAVLWMMVSGSVSPDGLLVGYVLGLAILYTMRVQNVKISWRRLPDQIAAFLVYTLTLARDVMLSSVDVARRVLDPELPLNPGRISVATQDETESDFIGAFSAHGITITPGELVVDFEDNRTMIVHCLDVEASAKIAEKAQARRLRLLRRIKGDS